LPTLAVEPKVVAFPAHTTLSVPATAMGNGFTVIITLPLFEHPVEVIVSVSVYIVVVNGFTVGLAKVETNPAGFETQE
jgi:hypothetical protein